MYTANIDMDGRGVSFETGLMAKQADGSVVVRHGDTVILATAVASRVSRDEIDFFPLTMDYQERAYCAGKIPGGFFKREGRPSEKETLTSRLIDRPIRPLFPKGFKCETQGIVTVLSLGEENSSDVLGVTAISAALMISDIPFDGPVSAVRIGRIEGRFIVNPDLHEEEAMDMDLVVAGSDEAVVMVEGMADQASEDDFIEAIDVAHAAIKRFNALQRDMASKVGKPKRAFTAPVKDEALEAAVREFAKARLEAAVRTADKLERQQAVEAVLNEVKAKFATEADEKARQAADIFHSLEKSVVRGMIVNEGVRADGRGPADIRPISSMVGLLPRTHGSALFQRGETQALVMATLGTEDDEQRIDALEGEYFKTFMLHYNFPPFSVGEAKFLRGPGRREIGHGNLAERSLVPLMPTKEEFPYTIRVVSEILESNGSSSMATVCGGTLCLMDAGVPIKAPVAGIAMGLISEGGKAVVLSDILGLEDHLGDMDFKVTGTERGITAFQMDSKLGGIDRDLMRNALEQARQGRIHILGKMKETLESPRTGLSKFAPRIFTIQINKEKIRDVIGTGGKVIRGITEQTGAKINVDDSGLISVASSDEEAAKRAIAIIEAIVEEPEVGRIYNGKVVRITDFGAFIEIMPGTDGLLHISQISHKRLEKVTDELNEGDEIPVKVIEIDKMGRVRLGRKELLPRPEGMGPEDESDRRDRGGERRGGDRGDRGGDRGGRPRRPKRD